MASVGQKKKVGNYYLVSHLGKGQFGTVYKGMHCEDSSKIFAIKAVNKESVQKDAYVHKLFQTEVEVMTKINSPNIMHLYEFIETANNYYLVIQYCNNGDLEKYLAKHGKLPEDQAVYFLMQIMNGFQTLNFHKIMHRDIKLANVFLNDDTIVIGDFGFAKKGVDVTKTKLGTPITMAPEMLNGNGSEYTNKADLWSIGIVFYQLLFGRIPFEVRNYDELKEKVQSQSGANLRFPPEIPISAEAKSILRQLLQSNPAERIEWNEFFQHKLFENKRNEDGSTLKVLTESRFDKQNEEKVKQEFEKNRYRPIKDELKEKFGNQKDENSKEEKDVAFEQIQMRYFNEKKKIIFMMFTVRKLRNLSKQRSTVDSLSERLMLSASILLQKALLFCNESIRELKGSDNRFGLPLMKKFTESPQAVRLLENYKEDEKVYLAFSEQMGSKFESEVSSAPFRAEWNRVKNFSYSNISTLDEMLIGHLKILYDGLAFLKISDEIQDEFLLVLLHLFHSIFSESSFKAKIDGSFQWKEFEAGLTPEAAKVALKTI